MCSETVDGRGSIRKETSLKDKSWISLQPLRIPPGWTIGINKLENLEPQELSGDDERWNYR